MRKIFIILLVQFLWMTFCFNRSHKENSDQKFIAKLLSCNIREDFKKISFGELLIFYDKFIKEKAMENFSNEEKNSIKNGDKILNLKYINILIGIVEEDGLAERLKLFYSELKEKKSKLIEEIASKVN